MSLMSILFGRKHSYGRAGDESHSPGQLHTEDSLWYSRQAHAEICPVCFGKGKIKTSEITTAGDVEKTCHGCNGTGWVIVP